MASHGLFCGWETWRNLDIIQTLMNISQTLNLISVCVLSLRHILAYCIQLWLLAKANLCDNDFVLFWQEISCLYSSINLLPFSLYETSSFIWPLVSNLCLQFGFYFRWMASSNVISPVHHLSDTTAKK